MPTDPAYPEKIPLTEQTAGKKIGVLVVDDHAVVRQGLCLFINMQDDMVVVGEGSNGREAIDLANRHHPDVIILDLQMPDLDGIEATRAILKIIPAARILILTSFSEDEMIFPAIRAGAIGYLLKDVQPPELLHAIRETFRGRSQLHPDVAHRLMQAVVSGPADRLAAGQSAGDGKDPGLTEREKEVLELIAQGLANREIAACLVISEKTVKTHVSSLLDKLGCEDRTRAAIWALKHGFGI